MKEFKGTPGPWEVEDNGHFYDINAGRATVGNVYSSASWFDNDIHRGPVAMANSQLIAAAPELLEALDKITKEYCFTRSQLNGDSEDDLADVLCVKNARAAIAKALGEKK